MPRGHAKAAEHPNGLKTSRTRRQLRSCSPLLVVLCYALTYKPVEAIKCFTGGVTYCGINADGGALPAAGGGYYVQGMNWACQDQQSNMDPTFIAPNCWDQASCEALQTDLFDDPFAVAHEPPYNYVADVGWISEQEAAVASSTPSPSSRSCPPEQPACGLQTTMRRGDDDCDQCYTRFRYSADMGAIYWNIWQIAKKCVKPGETCQPSTCNCTREAPYYVGECSVWAKSACRRKAYKCEHFPADYVVTTFQDYDIMFCSLGPDDEACSGCVACTDPSCNQTVIHVSRLPPKDLDAAGRAAWFQDSQNYNCSLERCGEAPRTCWNESCAYSDDCWPVCDPAIYARRIPAAVMGFYVTSAKGVMVEQVKCCDHQDYCNYPNPGSLVRPGTLGAVAMAVMAVVFAAATGEAY